MDIVTYPSEVLRKKAKPIENIDQEVKDLAEKMTEVLFRVEGMGLAAPQVGVAKQLIVVDLEEQFHVLVNPRKLEASDETDTREEGCLSLPGPDAAVSRPREAVVEGRTLEGETVRLNVEGIAARVFQHEIDHIQGTLFIDHLTTAKRSLVLREFEKSNGDG